MNALQQLLQKNNSNKGEDLGEPGIKAKSKEFTVDPNTGIATLTAEFDINDIITEGKLTNSRKEKYANVTVRIEGMPIRFTGNCFVKVG